MRWFIEVSRVGEIAPTEKYCLEAKQWQAALQEARKLRGDSGPLSRFSIELLDEGYRAVDPALKIRYLVAKAPHDAPISLPENSKAAPEPPPRTEPMASPEPLAPPSKPQRVEPAPKTDPMAAAPETVVDRAPAPAMATPEPAPSAGVQVVAVTPAAAERAPSAPPQPTYPTQRSLEVAKPPDFQLVRKREEEPSEKSPITYREYAYAVKPGTERAAAEVLLWFRFREIQASLEERAGGKFVQLAVFDHVFERKPVRAPIATLAWKDWRGDPVVQFPEPMARASSAPPAPPAPGSIPPPSYAPAAQPAAFPRPSAAPSAAPASVAPAVVAAPPAASQSVQPSGASTASAVAVALQPSAPPATAQPSAPPAEAKPSAPPAEAKPAEAKPSTPPAEAKPSTPPAEAKPSAPPAEAKPSAPPAEAKPSAPPAEAKPSAPPAEAKPSAPPAQAKPSAAPKKSKPAPAPEPEPPAPRRHGPNEDLIGELFEAMHDLHFASDIVTGAEYVLGIVQQLMPSEGVIIHVFDINTRHFVVVRASGPNPSKVLLHRTPDKQPLLTEAMRRTRSLRFDDATGDERFDAARWELLGIEAKRVMLGPAQQAGRYLGMIELANPDGGTSYHEGEANALDYICEQFADFVAARPLVLDADVVLGGKAR